MEYWIWLSLLNGIGPILAKKLLNEFKTPNNIYNAEEEQLLFVNGIGSKTAKMIIANKSLENSKILLETLYNKNIKLLTCYDFHYENIAFKYNEMPILLYYKGEIKNQPGVAVVGSRRCSSYGKRVATEAAEYLAKNNITVISGMAKGIDGYAHTACLNAGGYTIAFLGNGLDICYPKEHERLMVSIIEKGAVISEYLPGIKSRPEHFPRRNYLMCSWSEKVLVVEASSKSGALITADMAKNQNKKVLAVPSDIYNTTGQGTNQLIYEGAEIYLQPEQLLLDGSKRSYSYINNNEENTSKNKKEKLQIKRNFNEIETKIISCLTNDIKSIDEISRSIQISPSMFINFITTLEIEGIIKSLPGGKYTVET